MKLRFPRREGILFLICLSARPHYLKQILFIKRSFDNIRKKLTKEETLHDIFVAAKPLTTNVSTKTLCALTNFTALSLLTNNIW